MAREDAVALGEGQDPLEGDLRLWMQEGRGYLRGSLCLSISVSLCLLLSLSLSLSLHLCLCLLFVSLMICLCLYLSVPDKSL